MTVEWIKVPGRLLTAQAKFKTGYIEVVSTGGRRRFHKPWNVPDFTSNFYMIAPRPGHAPDLDNLEKPIIDALKKIVYLDDGQIHSRKSERLYCGDPVMSSANIMPPASELQRTAQLQKEECTFIGITDALL
jgi:Endodeoxyribonuclease RusA